MAEIVQAEKTALIALYEFFPFDDAAFFMLVVAKFKPFHPDFITKIQRGI